MSREVKRVPLDFKLGIKEKWKGYINPYWYPDECWCCRGDGYSAKAKEFSDQFWKEWQHNLDKDDIQALIDRNRLWEFTRVPITEGQKKVVQEKIENGGNSWLPYNNGYIPTEEEVREYSYQGFGFSGGDAYIVVEAKCKRLGFDHLCPWCKGEGRTWRSEKLKKFAEEWEPTDPPVGEGWQMWETVSEGSPISPVFETPQELARWLSNSSVFGANEHSYESWLSMIEAGWAPSGAMIDGKVVSGVEVMAMEKEKNLEILKEIY